MVTFRLGRLKEIIIRPISCDCDGVHRASDIDEISHPTIKIDGQANKSGEVLASLNLHEDSVHLSRSMLSSIIHILFELKARHYDLRPDNFIVQRDHETQLPKWVMTDIDAIDFLTGEEDAL